MPTGSTFRQTSVSTQTFPKRSPVWKKVLCTFTCCGRRANGENYGLVADEYTLPTVQPIQRRLPYLGPIQDHSHVIASREMKLPSSHLLSFLREDEDTHAMPSTKSSSMVKENQTTDIEFSREPSSFDTTTRAEPQMHHIQSIFMDAHRYSPPHHDEVPSSATNSVTTTIKAPLNHTSSEQKLSVGHHFEGCLSLRGGENKATKNVNIISLNFATLSSLSMNPHRNSSDVTIQHNRSTGQPAQCQDKRSQFRFPISSSLPRNLHDTLRSYPTYHRHLLHGKLDVHHSLKSTPNPNIISPCTSLSLARHRSRVIPTYHSCSGISIAVDFDEVDFTGSLKSIENRYFMFSKDVFTNQSSAAALGAIDNTECTTRPVGIKATVSCQIVSVTIPSSRGSSPRCHSAPTTVYFAKLSISTGENRSPVIATNMTRNEIGRGSQSAPDRLSNFHPFLSAICRGKPASVPMTYESLAAPVDMSAINVVASFMDDAKGHSLVYHLPECVSPIRDASSFCENIQTNSPIPSPVCYPVAVTISLNQQDDQGSGHVSAHSPSHLMHTDQLSHLTPLSKEEQRSLGIQVLPVQSAATNHQVVDTIRYDTSGCQLTRSTKPGSYVPVNHPTPGQNATRKIASPTAQGCSPKQLMIPSSANVTTGSSTGKNTTTAAIDNQNVQLPLFGQPAMPAWNCATKWDFNLFYQGASNNTKGRQPVNQPPQVPWQPIAPAPFNHNFPTTDKQSPPEHAQNNNAALHQPQHQHNPFQNFTPDLWNFQHLAKQSSPPKPLKPSDYNLPLTCKVIPKKDLEDVCNGKKEPTILGRGCFGEVRLMKELWSGRLCAVKVHHKDRDDKSIIKDLQGEVSTLTALEKLDCVPKLFGISRIGKNTDIPVLVQEFFGDPTTFKCTTLLDVINSKGLNGPSSFSVAIQLCRAMRDIHFVGILHCDVKVDNILFMKGSSGEDGDVRIKIIDFGKAVCRDDKPKYEYFPRDKHADILKECWQIAPEVVRGLRPYSLYTEVYAVGLVLTGIDVSPGKFLTKLGKKCLVEDWNQRPTIHEMIHDIDSYIKGKQASYSRWAKVG